MDLITASEGAIGCRRSTWHDPEMNAAIPFYRRMERLHDHAREIPQRTDWPQIAAIIDNLVTSAIHSASPSRVLLKEAEVSLGHLTS